MEVISSVQNDAICPLARPRRPHSAVLSGMNEIVSLNSLRGMDHILRAHNGDTGIGNRRKDPGRPFVEASSPAWPIRGTPHLTNMTTTLHASPSWARLAYHAYPIPPSNPARLPAFWVGESALRACGCERMGSRPSALDHNPASQRHSLQEKRSSGCANPKTVSFPRTTHKKRLRATTRQTQKTLKRMIRERLDPSSERMALPAVRHTHIISSRIFSASLSFAVVKSSRVRPFVLPYTQLLHVASRLA